MLGQRGWGLLLSEYPTLKEVFIVYDSIAREVKTEDEFFKIDLGGGTDASGALQLAKEILAERFPAGSYNRFVRHFSDGYDSADTVIPVAQDLSKDADYLGYSHVAPLASDGFDWPAELSDAYRVLAKQNPNKIGFAVLTNASVIETLKIFYGPRK